MLNCIKRNYLVCEIMFFYVLHTGSLYMTINVFVTFNANKDYVMLYSFYFEECERKRSKCISEKKHLDLFCSHTSIYNSS